jgi:hypothetical protein
MSEYLVNGLRLTVLRQNLEHYQRGGYAPPDAISRMLLSCTDAAWGAIQEAIDKGESAAELWVVKDSALEQIKLLAALAESVLPGAGLLNCVASELKRRLMEHAALTQESDEAPYDAALKIAAESSPAPEGAETLPAWLARMQKVKPMKPNQLRVKYKLDPSTIKAIPKGLRIKDVTREKLAKAYNVELKDVPQN